MIKNIIRIVLIYTLFFVNIALAEFTPETFTPQITSSYKAPSNCVRKGLVMKCQQDCGEKRNAGGGIIYNLKDNKGVIYCPIGFEKNIDKTKEIPANVNVVKCDSIVALFLPDALKALIEIYALDISNEEKAIRARAWLDIAKKGHYMPYCVNKTDILYANCFLDGVIKITEYDEIGIERAKHIKHNSESYCRDLFQSFYK